MMHDSADTIFALASGSGRAGVAVFRLSGSRAGEVYENITGQSVATPRLAARVKITDPDNAELIDDGLGLWFPAPYSFTGEDVVELHVHGGVAVIEGVAELISRQPGVRLAEPGEFSRRAFEHDKFDLTAAEGLADLVDAETAAQRRQALRQLQGELGRVYEDWRHRLLTSMALFEAEIDFSEEDIPADLIQKVRREVDSLSTEISRHLADDGRGQMLRDGVYITIVGPPNAGKSSLLNRLARRDAAIVSATAGTTRDVIEVHLNLGGYPVVLADTAGLRDAGDDVETEGVRRALDRAESGDLILAVFDGAVLPDLDPKTRSLVDDQTVVVVNKSDLGVIDPNDVDPGWLPVSAKTGAGFEELLSVLESAVAGRLHLTSNPALTRLRHRRALESCHRSLVQFRSATETELAAEDLRLAARDLGRITGRIDVEQVLDVIFREFCIGK